METKLINLNVRKIKSEKGEFFAYSASKKTGGYITVKFTKSVEVKPERHSFITVNVNNMSIATETNKKGEKFDVLWVSKIEKIEPIDIEAFNEWFE